MALPLYDITDHAMLTDAAKALSPEDLLAHNIAAEFVLRFADFTPFTAGSDNFARAQVAVAMQVSFQVECGIEAFVLSSFRRGSRAGDFRRGARNMTVVHPTARKIASKLRQAATGG